MPKQKALDLSSIPKHVIEANNASLERSLARYKVRPFADGLFPESQERALIELTLELANAADEYDLERAVDKFRDWFGVSVGLGSELHSDPGEGLGATVGVAKRARDRLALISKERTLDGSQIADPVRTAVASVGSGPLFVMLVGVERDADGDIGHYAVIKADLETVVTYAISLIVSRRRSYYRELRLCALQDCGRFFLAHRVGKGRPPTMFCPDRGCKTRYHSRLSGAERTRKSRARPSPRRKASTTRKPK